MRKLSQKELLEEGFRSVLSGITRGLRNATGSIATAIAPETMGALKAGAGIAAGAVERIRSGSPSAAVGSFFDSEDGKREFKDIKIGKEFKKMANQNWKIPITSGFYLNSVGGDQIEEKDLSGGYVVLRRKKRGGAGGFDNEIIEVWDSNNKRLNDKPIKAGSDDPSAVATGQDGKPGTDGKPGADGKPGTDGGTSTGRDGKDGKDGENKPLPPKPPKPKPPTPKPKPPKPKPKKLTSRKTSNQIAGEKQIEKNKAAAKKEAKSTKRPPTLSTLNAALADIKKPGFQQDKVAKNEIKDYIKTSGKINKINSDPKHRPSIAGRRISPLQAKKLLEKKRSQKNILRVFKDLRFN